MISKFLGVTFDVGDINNTKEHKKKKNRYGHIRAKRERERERERE